METTVPASIVQGATEKSIDNVKIYYRLSLTYNLKITHYKLENYAASTPKNQKSMVSAISHILCTMGQRE